tara:strand:- start:448 stop:1611 length:1164 start_codon:yes stop_codon:yes gene_type:complete
MENFVIIKREKDFEEIPKFLCKDFEDSLDKSIMGGGVLCVHGPSGCGKSFIVKEILRNYTWIDFHCDILKSRKETEALFEKIRGTDSVILFDDVDIETCGWKYSVDFINSRKYTTGPIIIVSRISDKIINQISDIKCIPAPLPTVKDINILGKEILKSNDLIFEDIWNGNLRNFVMAVNCYKTSGLKVDRHDEFFSTQESVRDLICKGGRGYERFIGQGIEEHGHTQDLIFTNYQCDSIEDCARVAHCMSEADVWDGQIYSGNWDFLPYFANQACVMPAKIIGNRVDHKSLKPGSSWTKHYNFKMREKHVENFIRRNNSSNFNIDFFTYLSVFIKNLEPDEIMKLLREYDIRSADIDLMNHITLQTRLKGKKILYIKKALKNDYDGR